MKDPAFLFYDGDAAKDVSHMNRLERGCYFDLIQAQRKFGRMSENIIRKILGKDFDLCWESVKICLSYDNDMYFIEWVEISTIKRKEYSESRRKNRVKIEYANNQEDKEIICKSYDEHMVNEIENKNEDEIVIIKNTESEQPKIKTEGDLLNDFCIQYFDHRFINEKSKDMFDKLIRIDKFTSLEIQKAIKLARSVPFWNSNFLSPLKLRDKDAHGVRYIERFLQIVPTQQKTQQSDAGSYVAEKLDRLARTGHL